MKLQSLQDKRILITGAGGSLGSELCRELIKHDIERLYMIDVSENNLYEIDCELQPLRGRVKVVPIIGDIQDEYYIESVFRRLLPDIVIHTAALKQVPFIEKNKVEAVKTNLFGTANIVMACNEIKARLIHISTDKAANPVNTYGISKKLAENYVLRYVNDGYIFRLVNLIGSVGSVIPLWEKQLKETGRITITDERMERYVIGINEAAKLIINSIDYAEHKDILIPAKIQHVKIMDIAKKMAEERGMELKYDIIGLRDGEKLWEELTEEGEALVFVNKKINKVVKAKLDKYNIDMMYKICYYNDLYKSIYRDVKLMEIVIKECV